MNLQLRLIDIYRKSELEYYPNGDRLLCEACATVLQRATQSEHHIQCPSLYAFHTLSSLKIEKS